MRHGHVQVRVPRERRHGHAHPLGHVSHEHLVVVRAPSGQARRARHAVPQRGDAPLQAHGECVVGRGEAAVAVHAHVVVARGARLGVVRCHHDGIRAKAPRGPLEVRRRGREAVVAHKHVGVPRLRGEGEGHRRALGAHAELVEPQLALPDKAVLREPRHEHRGAVARLLEGDAHLLAAHDGCAQLETVRLGDHHRRDVVGGLRLQVRGQAHAHGLPLHVVSHDHGRRAPGVRVDHLVHKPAHPAVHEGDLALEARGGELPAGVRGLHHGHGSGDGALVEGQGRAEGGVREVARPREARRGVHREAGVHAREGGGDGEGGRRVAPGHDGDEEGAGDRRVGAGHHLLRSAGHGDGLHAVRARRELVRGRVGPRGQVRHVHVRVPGHGGHHDVQVRVGGGHAHAEVLRGARPGRGHVGHAVLEGHGPLSRGRGECVVGRAPPVHAHVEGARAGAPVGVVRGDGEGVRARRVGHPSGVGARRVGGAPGHVQVRIPGDRREGEPHRRRVGPLGERVEL
mmetsp:Transcript_3336/g.11046  ORF Transcript_3336/g.11046 Transcript_3336/m.11046 type:complete len:514 (+) Transcript_3336:1450-2991(+)